MSQAQGRTGSRGDVPESGQAEAPRDRHARQMLFGPIGRDGQARLAGSRVLMAGLGATGGAIADMLARAGIGLTLVDRDYVERTNLQRQTLYSDADVDRPKAVAALERLRAVDPELPLRAEVADLHAGNILRIARGHDLIVDGSDNFALRYVLNDAALELGIPWVYSAAVASQGAVLPVAAGGRPCLRCLHPDPPEPGSLATCDTAGVIQPAVAAVAAIAATAAMRLLLGQPIQPPGLRYVEAWSHEWPVLELSARPDCPSCARGERPALDPERRDDALASVLCGREAVHIRPAPARLDLAGLADRLSEGCQVSIVNDFLLRFEADGLETTLFADGRAVIKGSDDPARARGHYAKWIGL